jgi:hypothetical protein
MMSILKKIWGERGANYVGFDMFIKPPLLKIVNYYI